MSLGLSNVHQTSNSSVSHEKRRGSFNSLTGHQNLVDVWRKGASPCHVVVIDNAAANVDFIVRCVLLSHIIYSICFCLHFCPKVGIILLQLLQICLHCL